MTPKSVGRIADFDAMSRQLFLIYGARMLTNI
jgi:hypothetical protein